LRSFLGLAGYYRKFVKHFAIIAKPLHNLLKKGALFVWTQDHQLAFSTLKQALISAPVLALPNFAKPFCLETDACKNGVGAVLLQEGHPLAFLSKPLGTKTQGLSTYEKEYLAILIAVDQWRHYLLHAEFVIFTDQKSLIHLNEQRMNTPWQQKVFTKLLGMQYKIVYKPGSDNRVADALSRRVHDTPAVLAISACSPQWCQDIIDGYLRDEEAKRLLAKLVVNGSSVPHFSLQDGIIKFKNKIWVGNNQSMHQAILEAIHSSAVGGHSGFPVTYHKLKQLFSWPGMRKFAKQFVASCSVCQQSKPERIKYPGLLQPLPVPAGAWQTVTMDFVEGLPTSGNKNCVMVVVDKFSKFSHFIALKHPFSALVVAKHFMQHVYKLHGLPAVIVSDRDRIFTSHLWQALFKLADVKLHMSSSYHPQTDGQTERVNQCMETFLRCFANACPSKWINWLYLAEFWYNSCKHESLGLSPFEVLYGYSPKPFGLNVVGNSQNQSLDEWLQDKAVISTLVQQHLHRAQLRMKTQADKSRSERVFAVGDQVYLRLQPYIQSSLAPRSNQKLAFRYFGPFTVLNRVGSVAYKLDLPASSKIHPIFHVSQLKKAISPTTAVAQLPQSLEGLQIPEKILQRSLNSAGLSQLLIQWSGMPPSLATWEDELLLRQKFPFAPAWGQAGSHRRGIVTDTVQECEEGDSTTSEIGNVHGPTAGLASSSKVPRMSSRIRKPNVRVAGPEWRM
jgi:transposase InsO family protein